MNDVLIVTGGQVCEEELIKYCKEHQHSFVIGVDKGLETLHKLNIVPRLVIGDFDSADDSIRAIYTNSTDALILNPEKDYTDTHVAVMEALKLKPEKITLFGATGTRLDHTMANIGLLKLCLLEGVEAVIYDGNNKIIMIDKQCRIKRKNLYGKYISCMPFSDKVTGITLTGFKYGLDNATMIKEETIGISNQLREEEGLITIRDGYLLVMETKD